MTSMTTDSSAVTGGVDTHGQTHHGAALDSVGRQLGDREFPTTPAGYRALVNWLQTYGHLERVGVEGTGTYGAGLTRQLRAAGVTVVEVDRPDRKARRAQGKSDPLDAYSAARAALARKATGVPKTQDGRVEAIRLLRGARSSAVIARSGATPQLKALLVTAPAELREQLRTLSNTKLIATCARLRPTGDIADPEQATKTALRRLARRHQYLSEEITAADTELRTLVTAAAPRLIALPGVGTEVAGQILITAGDNPDRLRSEAAFAHLCGVAPIPASSGRAASSSPAAAGRGSPATSYAQRAWATTRASWYVRASDQARSRADRGWAAATIAARVGRAARTAASAACATGPGRRRS